MTTSDKQMRVGLITIVLSISAICFAIAAQYLYTVQNRQDSLVWVLAGLSGLQWLAVLFQKEVRYGLARAGQVENPLDDFDWSPGRRLLIGGGLLWMGLVFWLSWDAVFDPALIICWAAGIGYWWLILSEAGHREIKFPRNTIPINAELIAFLLILLIGAFSLYFRLDDAPHGMIPDHAEKIFDLVRIEKGYLPTYFGAHSGREPLHFYLTYTFSGLFGYSFLSLKLASSLIALLMLPALYWLGRQIDGRLTGLLAMALGSVSVWQLIMGRSGFRAGEAALAATLLLAAFWGALRSGKRGDFLLTGLILGIGLYTYTGFRIAPLLVLVGFGLRWLMTERTSRQRLIFNLGALVALSLMVYLPLLAYWVRYPNVYWYRSQQMVGLHWTENLRRFGDALLSSLGLFNVTSDSVMLNVVPYRPAVGVVSGALLLLGLAFWLWRVMQNRRFTELLLPLALFIFVLPSALAISTPLELPSARRATVAFPVVMVLGAVSLSLPLRAISAFRPRWMFQSAALISVLALLTFHTLQDWDAYFNVYTPYNNNAILGPPAIAEQIIQFEHLGGSRWNAFVLFSGDDVWIDSRLVAIWLGEPTRWLDTTNVIFMTDRAVCQPILDDGTPFMIFLQVNYTQELEALQGCFPDHVWYSYYENGQELFKVFYVLPPLRSTS